jgi:hypothetical protein
LSQNLDDLVEAAVSRALARALGPIREELAAIRRALPPSLGSLRDAAKILHCDPSTAYRAYKRGELAGRQIGGRIVIDLAALRPPTEEEAIEATWPPSRRKLAVVPRATLPRQR